VRARTAGRPARPSAAPARHGGGALMIGLREDRGRVSGAREHGCVGVRKPARRRQGAVGQAEGGGRRGARRAGARRPRSRVHRQNPCARCVRTCCWHNGRTRSVRGGRFERKARPREEQGAAGGAKARRRTTPSRRHEYIGPARTLGHATSSRCRADAHWHTRPVAVLAVRLWDERCACAWTRAETCSRDPWILISAPTRAPRIARGQAGPATRTISSTCHSALVSALEEACERQGREVRTRATLVRRRRSVFGRNTP